MLKKETQRKQTSKAVKLSSEGNILEYFGILL